MDSLRWVILAVGVVVVFIIYWLGRKNDKSKQLDLPEPFTADEMPYINTRDDGFESARTDTSDEPPFVASEINHFEINKELIDTITESVDVLLPEMLRFEAEEIASYTEKSLETEVVDPELDAMSEQMDAMTIPDDDLVVIHVQARTAYFNGADLLHVINYQQLKFGDMDIYHAYDENNETVFSMSNMVQPGHFEPDHIADMRTPGVILFTQLSLLKDPEAAVDRLLHCADTLARELDAKLTTSNQQALNDEMIHGFKDKAEYFKQSSIPA